MTNPATLGRFGPPPGWQFDNFKNADGKAVRYGHAVPAGEIRGTVVITTGYADFIESYFETIHDYLDRGFAVYAMDWAGQGGSERYFKEAPWLPNPGGFFANIRDLHHFRQAVMTPQEGKPVFLSSHSMGGHIGLHVVQKYPADFDFAVLAAPLADFDLSERRKKLVEAFAAVATRLGQGNRKISGRRRVVQEIKKDREQYVGAEPVRMRIHKIYAELNPALRIGDPTIAWVMNTFKAVRALNEPENLKSISVPVLVGIAENDRLVNTTATLRTLRQVKSAKPVIVKEASHALWTERTRIRDAWWQEVDRFVEERLKAFIPAARRSAAPVVTTHAAPPSRPSPPRPPRP